MEKKVLAEIALYHGDVSMPKDWQIDPIELAHYILQYQIDNKKFSYSRTWDKLNTYICEHIRLEYNINLINKKTWGNIYSKVKDCNVIIHYDDNRRKGKTWTIPLSNNKFIMFPSTQMYHIINHQKDSLNFVQTITYEYI
jgi:hypothetical protein